MVGRGHWLGTGFNARASPSPQPSPIEGEGGAHCVGGGSGMTGLAGMTQWVAGFAGWPYR